MNLFIVAPEEYPALLKDIKKKRMISVNDLCNEMGISLPTLYKAFREEGVNHLSLQAHRKIRRYLEIHKGI